MNWILIIGLAASFVGFAWAIVEREIPDYWRILGISRTTEGFIRIATALLWPGAYLVILLSSTRWLLNVGILAVWHFVILPITTAPVVVLLNRALGNVAERDLEEADRLLNSPVVAEDDTNGEDEDEEGDDLDSEDVREGDGPDPSVEPSTDDARRRLYLMVNIASNIRMEHAISIDDAMEYVSSYLQTHTWMINSADLIQAVLDSPRPQVYTSMLRSETDRLRRTGDIITERKIGPTTVESSGLRAASRQSGR